HGHAVQVEQSAVAVIPHREGPAMLANQGAHRRATAADGHPGELDLREGSFQRRQLVEDARALSDRDEQPERHWPSLGQLTGVEDLGTTQTAGGNASRAALIEA